MCRMIACRGDLALALKALALAARSDKHLAELGVEPPTHHDGWGMVCAEPPEITLEYRSLKPVYEDTCYPEPQGKVILAHARRASPEFRETLNLASTQPLRKEHVIFMHNGTVDPEALAAEYGLARLRKPCESDSVALFNAFLAELDLRKSFEAAFQELLKKMEPHVRGKGYAVIAYNLNTRELLATWRGHEYYSLYAIRGPVEGVASITVAEELEECTREQLQEGAIYKARL